MDIGWIQISSKKYGGANYNQRAIEAIEKDFNVEQILREARIFKKIKYLKIPEALFYLIKLKGKKNLWVRDFYSTIVLNKKKTVGKNLVMIHHVDSLAFPLAARPFLLFLEIIFYKKLKKADFIVTVSEYWKNHFLKKGFNNVYKIYNGFDLENYNISDKEVENFKKEKNLSKKPIIYLGNCQPAKGVAESCRTLKEIDAYLVTSGPRQVKISALNFNLSHREYLCLLKASSIVLTMSKMKEGWCRTAHEAMLLKVPVIGSGAGGMKELLEDGRQIICPDFKDLKNIVINLLDNQKKRKEIGEFGYDYAKNFTLEKFQNDWRNLINKIMC